MSLAVWPPEHLAVRSVTFWVAASLVFLYPMCMSNTMYKLRLGVVGFSAKSFDQVTAKKYLEEGIRKILTEEGVAPNEVELVSGLTNMGVPKLSYELAVAMKIRTVGISAAKAKKFSRFPVDKTIYAGKDFGDESPIFIEYITHLLRVGGGKQSRHEAELFKAKFANAPEALSRHLLEYEVDWYGR
jgi:hypothetical protein